MLKCKRLALLWLALSLPLFAQTYPAEYATPSVIAAGSQNVSIALTAVGSPANGGRNWTSGAAPFTADGLSIQSQSVTDANHATVVVNASSTPQMSVVQDPYTGNNFVVYVKYPFSLNHTYIKTGTTRTLAAQGVGTNWTSSTTFTLSGCPTASISSKAVTSATSVDLTIAAGNTDCSGVTITDGSTSKTATFDIYTPKTYYVRGDGGGLYTAARDAAGDKDVRCSGFSNAAYPGTGKNQACAISDLRLLFDDQQHYGQQVSILQHGDTAILTSVYPTVNGVLQTGWRMGWDPGTDYNKQPWCVGTGQGPFYCNNPKLPEDISLLGENYASCSTGVSTSGTNAGLDGTADRTKMVQVFGGQSLYTMFSLGGSKHFTAACLELTSHSNCLAGGQTPGGQTPTSAPQCNNQSFPYDDYSDDAFDSDTSTDNAVFRDLWIHNMKSRGFKGAYGSTGVTAVRVTIGYAKSTGWDLDAGNNGSTALGAVLSPANNTIPNIKDDGSGTYASPLFKLRASTIEWSGCAQQYPMPADKKAIPLDCFGQSTQGQGDGIGSANVNQETDVDLEQDIFRYNSQEGEDFGHVYGQEPHIFTAISNWAYGNQGSQLKNGGGFATVLYANNLLVGNCARFTAVFPDAPANYAADFTDYCRSGGDTFSVNFNDTTQATWVNNTVLTSANSGALWNCTPGLGQSNCTHANWTLINNIFRGYAEPFFYNSGGYGGTGKAAMYCGMGCNGNNQALTLGTWKLRNNNYYGFRTCPANSEPGPGQAVTLDASGETCTDPHFTNEPDLGSSQLANESDLDNFIASLDSSSPAIGGGATQNYVITDAAGASYLNPPSVGALERNSSITLPIGTTYYSSAATTPTQPTTPTTPVSSILHIFGTGLSGHF